MAFSVFSLEAKAFRSPARSSTATTPRRLARNNQKKLVRKMKFFVLFRQVFVTWIKIGGLYVCWWVSKEIRSHVFICFVQKNGQTCKFSGGDVIRLFFLSEDVFAIDEVTMYEGEWTEKNYAVAGDILDGQMYDLFMNMLDER